MDNFREEIVIKRKNKALLNIIYYIVFASMVLCAVMGATGLFSFLNFNSDTMVPALVFFLVFGGTAALLFWRKDFIRVEYEYTLTNGLVEVAMVMNNSRRKELLNFKMQDVRVVAPLDDPRLREYAKEPGVKKIKTVLNVEVEHYFVYIQRGEQRTLLYMEPTREFLADMKLYAERNADFQVT